MTDDEKPIVKALLAEGWRNQDIQALLNIGRDATVNSGRITEVKQNENIEPSPASDVEFFKAKKQAFDPRTGLNLFDDERLIRAREAIILAVQIFNSPTMSFKSEVFCVLANIAWTYLLHEYYLRQNIKIESEDGHSLLLSQMLNRADCPLSRGIRDNLTSIKFIRDDVEHKLLRRADKKWLGLFQACCLNFDKSIRELFGADLSLQNELAFALQFAKLSMDQVTTLQNYEVPEEMEALDARIRADLTDAQLNDLEYQFRVIYTLDASSKSKSNIQFVHPESKEAEQIRQVLVKYKTADELYPYKPSKVVQLVTEKSKMPFSSHMHTLAWKKYKARPKHRSAQPNNTNKDYCIFHPTHGDYTYSEKWVQFLVEMVGDAAELAALKAWK